MDASGWCRPEASIRLQLEGGNFKALTESKDQKTLKNASIACQIVNSFVTNRNVWEQLTADCDMSIRQQLQRRQHTQNSNCYDIDHIPNS